MTTTDSNGVVSFTTTDPIVPFQSTLNSLGSSISTKLTSMQADSLYYAATAADATTKVNALSSAGIIGTTANPLMFFRLDTKTLWSYNGTTWTEQVNVIAGSMSSSAVQAVGPSTWSQYGFSSPTTRLSGGVTSSTGGLKVPVSGWYSFGAYVSYSANTNQSRCVIVYVNGERLPYTENDASAGPGGYSRMTAGVLYLNANDVVGVGGYQDSGAVLNFTSGAISLTL